MIVAATRAVLDGAMDALAPYRNFVLVVGAQLLWFLVVALRYRSLSRAPAHLALGAAIGIPVGAVFDVAIGKFHAIFHYAGLEMQGPFVLVNAIFSYGLAIATVLARGVEPMPRFRGRRRRMALLAASFLFVLVVWLPLDRWPPIAAMFLAGAIILAFAESVCLAMGRKGALALFVEGRWSPAATIWAFSVVTGLVYELANYFFPLWIWINQAPTPAGNLALIVAFGYFVLFYPIFAIVGILVAQPGSNSRADSVT